MSNSYYAHYLEAKFRQEFHSLAGLPLTDGVAIGAVDEATKSQKVGEDDAGESSEHDDQLEPATPTKASAKKPRAKTTPKLDDAGNPIKRPRATAAEMEKRKADAQAAKDAKAATKKAAAEAKGKSPVKRTPNKKKAQAASVEGGDDALVGDDSVEPDAAKEASLNDEGYATAASKDKGKEKITTDEDEDGGVSDGSENVVATPKAKIELSTPVKKRIANANPEESPTPTKKARKSLVKSDIPKKPATPKGNKLQATSPSKSATTPQAINGSASSASTAAPLSAADQIMLNERANGTPWNNVLELYKAAGGKIESLGGLKRHFAKLTAERGQFDDVELIMVFAAYDTVEKEQADEVEKLNSAIAKMEREKWTKITKMINDALKSSKTTNNKTNVAQVQKAIKINKDTFVRPKVAEAAKDSGDVAEASGDVAEASVDVAEASGEDEAREA